jgi:hypothetical protein
MLARHTLRLPRGIDPATPCQRWRNGCDRYRPAGEVIDVSRYGVDVLPERVAREFVHSHHYSRSYPASRLAVGLFEAKGNGRPVLSVVAVFSVPMSNHIVPRYTGLEAARGVELGRFVLLDECPGNSETWFLGQAFRVMRSELPDVRAVLSYADPVGRVLEDGCILKPGHVGCISKSHNGIYVGRGSPKFLILSRDGRVLSARTLSKLRNGERGADGAYRQLLSMGASERRLGEDIHEYVNRAISNGPFVRARHPGNHLYLWAIGGRNERRRVEAGFMPALPYPQVADAPILLKAA